jgi:hypothetical protein
MESPRCASAGLPKFQPSGSPCEIPLADSSACRRAQTPAGGGRGNRMENPTPGPWAGSIDDAPSAVDPRGTPQDDLVRGQARADRPRLRWRRARVQRHRPDTTPARVARFALPRPHQKDHPTDEHDHDTRRDRDLLQGLGQRPRRHVLARVAVERRCMGRPAAVPRPARLPRRRARPPRPWALEPAGERQRHERLCRRSRCADRGARPHRRHAGRALDRRWPRWPVTSAGTGQGASGRRR